MTKITCAIIDDEPLALNLLESYVGKTPFLELKGKYSSAVQAIRGLQEQEVQLLFLDIQMPELTGLEFSKMVSEKTRIIFTTAFSQYALEGYKVNALDYLLKPFSYADFLKASKKALEWFELVEKKTLSGEGGDVRQPQSSVDSIFVKSEYKLVQIMLDEILYVEGLKDYLKIYTSADTKPILSLMSMKSMEELLPSDRFMRVHRSYIVQANKIRVIDRNRIVFGKTFIPISDSYKAIFNEFLNSRTH